MEVETSKRVAVEIRALGYDVTENVGGHGIVAVMRNGSGPTVLLRADMDGLPIEEKSGVPYASTVRQVDVTGAEQPVMHACGHDVHITALIGTAKQMAARKNQWSGTLVLVGQPSEERANGARDMLADGLYTRFPKPDYALGFHVWATVAAGTIIGAAENRDVERGQCRHRRARRRHARRVPAPHYGAPEHGVKSVFFFVGGTPAAELANAAPHHSAQFKIAPEPSVTTGIEAMVVGALTLLGTH